MSETTEKHSPLSRLGRWLAELLLVFVGVYAAFWLNNYQQHREQKMPPLRPFAFFTDYNPADIATLLQAGGIELLDIKTLTVLRQMETDVRTDLSTLAHFEKLSDQLIAPNLDQDISFFYDPATKKLRKRFEKYPQGLNATVKLFHDMEKTQTELLKQVRAERQRH